MSRTTCTAHQRMHSPPSTSWRARSAAREPAAPHHLRARAPAPRQRQQGGSLRQRRWGVASRRLTACVSSGDDEQPGSKSSIEKLTDKYNDAMKLYSDKPFEYNHDAGLYYHFVDDDLIVGTQPQTPEDVLYLKNVEGVTCIMNTQQSKDWEYWNVDFAAIKQTCEDNDMAMERVPFPDFDAQGLQRGLPKAAAILDTLLRSGHRVYLHCTAGMGRSPGVAIGYLYWFGEHRELDAAYDMLTSIRPCGPNKAAIQGATVDILRLAAGKVSENELSEARRELPALDCLLDGEGADQQADLIVDTLRGSTWAFRQEERQFTKEKKGGLFDKFKRFLFAFTTGAFVLLVVLAFIRLLMRVCLAI